MAAALVPELYVRDLPRSLSFYCDALGFRIVYQRAEERFAYIERAGAELMLEKSPSAAPGSPGLWRRLMDGASISRSRWRMPPPCATRPSPPGRR